MSKCVNTLNGDFFRYNRLYTLDRLFWKVSGNEWRDNTENGRIEKNSTDEKPPVEVNEWGGDDFVAKEEPAAETGEEDSASKGMSAEQAAAAALAVAAAGAALLRKRGGKQPEKGGLYITESDRTTLLEKINQIASSTYYIDEEG